MKYKYYLFDLDGVLVNTDHIQYETTREAILDIKNYDISIEPTVNEKFCSTITTIEKLQLLSKYIFLSTNEIEIIYQNKRKKADLYFSKLTIDETKVLLFSYLKTNNCKIAVVTNSNKTSTNIILKNIGIYNYIDIIITNEDVSNKKPFPDPYLKAIQELNASLKDCIIFEDSSIGLLSAQQSGCDYYHVKNYNDINIKLIEHLNMFLISHRGNINGKQIEFENKPEYLLQSISKGFHVETDLWVINNKLYLGHDNPEYEINIEFLLDIKDKLFCHCKNIDALFYLINNYPQIECFYHDNDECTLTSHNHLWTFPGKKLTPLSICVMPEYVNQHPTPCYGVCTDTPSKYLIHILNFY
jgi:beta-phosphoglucomutase-like phosphatase (HAD superfamily)